MYGKVNAVVNAPGLLLCHYFKIFELRQRSGHMHNSGVLFLLIFISAWKGSSIELTVVSLETLKERIFTNMYS